MHIILASASPYRAQLLRRLGLPFTSRATNVDETPRPGEPPAATVSRLAVAKARAVATSAPALVIGSDQLAELDGTALGKPGNAAAAHAQLARLSGRSVRFLTGLCVLQRPGDDVRVLVEPYRVHFRHLTGAQIDRYLAAEAPLDCAAAFKSEGLGISLVEAMDGDDPTALIGLPLIQLVNLLHAAGVAVPPAPA